MAKKKEPPALDEFFEMSLEVASDTDRARALVLTAWLDDALEQYLRTRVVDDPKVVDTLFGQDRPLATFSVRIKVVYAFGYVSEGVYRDLHTIREVRNCFAHARGPISFDDQSITDKCKNLDIIQRYHASEGDPARHITTVRKQFQVAAFVYTSFFLARMDLDGKAHFRGNSAEKTFIHDVVPLFVDHWQGAGA